MADISSSLAAAFGLLIIAVCLLYSYFKHVYAHFEKIGIPYVKPTMLVGSLFEMRKKPNAVFFKEYATKFGTSYGFFVLNKPMICLFETESIKDMVIKKFPYFKNRPIGADNGNRPMGSKEHGLLQMHGEQWKRNRSALSPAFSSGKMKQMLSLIKESTETLVDVIGESKGEGVNVNRIFEAYTMEVIGTTAFGVQLDSQRNQEERFLIYSRKVLLFLQENNMLLDYSIFDKGKHLRQFWGDALESLYSSRVGKNTRKDLLQSMLERVPKSTSEQSEGGHMTKEEVKGNMMVFLLAGYETTSNALSYTSYLLATNMEAQDLLYEEIQESIGDKEVVYDAVAELSYLDQVLKESLRIYPPAHTFGRRCEERCELEGVGVVEKNTVVVVPVLALHHSDKFWDQPGKFKPERFSKENESKIVPYSYLPFGEGQRQCIGMRFAMLEAKVALIQILRKYRIETCALTENPPQLAFGVTMTAKNGIRLKFVPR